MIAADCGFEVGTGHVMRCMALAQNWKRAGGSVTFLLPQGSEPLGQRISCRGFSLEVLDRIRFFDLAVHRILTLQPHVAVLDGYGFGAQQLAALSEAGIRVLMLDDYGHASAYPVRWILNPNLHARPEFYPRRSHDTQLLLGPDYALLRKEFLPWIGWRRAIPDNARKILVTIGGSDPANLSLRILDSLAALAEQDFEVVFVIGGGNPHLNALPSALNSLVPVRIIRDVSDMPALMAWADIAISGAGGTAWELCYMGLPSLLFVVAENQRLVASQLSELSAAVLAGEACDFDPRKFGQQLRHLINAPDLRRKMSDCGRKLVDGLGADRVRRVLVDRELRLRPARNTDCELLFSWANDAAVRSASFYPAPVLWQEHASWFAQKMNDPESVIYIGETNASEPVGQVRFQLEGDEAILSTMVAPSFRGAGWGKELVSFSIRTLVRSRPVRRVKAFVKPENRASVRLFGSAAFRRDGDDQVAGQAALRFAWDSRSPICA